MSLWWGQVCYKAGEASFFALLGISSYNAYRGCRSILKSVGRRNSKRPAEEMVCYDALPPAKRVRLESGGEEGDIVDDSSSPSRTKANNDLIPAKAKGLSGNEEEAGQAQREEDKLKLSLNGADFSSKQDIGALVAPFSKSKKTVGIDQKQVGTGAAMEAKPYLDNDVKSKSAALEVVVAKKTKSQMDLEIAITAVKAQTK